MTTRLTDEQIAELERLAVYLRGEADFNRSWTDGRRSAQGGPSYVARRLELAAEREGWAAALVALLSEVRASRAAATEGLAAKVIEAARDLALTFERVPSEDGWTVTTAEEEEACALKDALRALDAATPPPGSAAPACDGCGGAAPFWVHKVTAERLCYVCIQKRDNETQRRFEAYDLPTGYYDLPAGSAAREDGAPPSTAEPLDPLEEIAASLHTGTCPHVTEEETQPIECFECLMVALDRAQKTPAPAPGAAPATARDDLYPAPDKGMCARCGGGLGERHHEGETYWRCIACGIIHRAPASPPSSVPAPESAPETEQ